MEMEEQLRAHCQLAANDVVTAKRRLQDSLEALARDVKSAQEALNERGNTWIGSLVNRALAVQEESQDLTRLREFERNLNLILQACQRDTEKTPNITATKRVVPADRIV